MSIIPPTIGRVVWFYDQQHHPSEAPYQPEAALVTYVHGNHMVNLAVFDANGENRGVASVPLVQPGEPRPPIGSMFCEWMPYQIGQAQKYEEAAKTS